MQCSYFSKAPFCNFSSFRRFCFLCKTVLISVPTHVIVIVIVVVVVVVVDTVVAVTVVVVVVVVFVVFDTEMSA